MTYEERKRLLYFCTEVYDRGGDCLSENETQELALLARTALSELEEADHYADECAHAIGVEYAAEGHRTVRGPLDQVVHHIRAAVRDAGELIDVRNALEQETARLDWMLSEGDAKFAPAVMRRGIDRELAESGTKAVLESKGDA